MLYQADVGARTGWRNGPEDKVSRTAVRRPDRRTLSRSPRLLSRGMILGSGCGTCPRMCYDSGGRRSGCLVSRSCQTRPGLATHLDDGAPVSGPVKRRMGSPPPAKAAVDPSADAAPTPTKKRKPTKTWGNYQDKDDNRTRNRAGVELRKVFPNGKCEKAVNSTMCSAN